MGLYQQTTPEKLSIACQRWDKYMRYLLPGDIPASGWVEAIAKKHGLGIDGDEIFENIYRCYHASFKVLWMQQNPIHFIDLLLFLFNNRIDHSFAMNDNTLGFPDVFEETFGKDADADIGAYLSQLHNIFRPNGLSYQYCRDILQRNPIASGWQIWEQHHLAFLGGTLWTIIAGTSILGMLKWEAEYREAEPIGWLISYPEGVANYISSDINIQGINDPQPDAAGDRSVNQENINSWTQALVSGGVQQLQKTLPEAEITIKTACMMESYAEVRADIAVKEGDVVTECELRCAYGHYTIRFPDVEKTMSRDYTMDYVGRQGSMAKVREASQEYAKKRGDWLGI